MDLSSELNITYTPRPGTSAEDEISALSTVYRFLLLEKGDCHDLTNNPTPKMVKNGPRKIDKEKT
jgi:hypothetical protein